MAPELDYSALEHVQDGVGARLAYIEAALDPDTTAERRQLIKKALRVYCCRGTWALVAVAHHLAQKVNLLPKMPLT